MSARAWVALAAAARAGAGEQRRRAAIRTPCG
ncbi:MAG: hypothetical protein QOG42_1294, partial [Solirubrobacteraceae bacterium]|nr:hypothetical protein [Solirubrobacteraceae bacterium]